MSEAFERELMQGWDVSEGSRTPIAVRAQRIAIVGVVVASSVVVVEPILHTIAQLMPQPNGT